MLNKQMKAFGLNLGDSKRKGVETSGRGGGTDNSELKLKLQVGGGSHRYGGGGGRWFLELPVIWASGGCQEKNLLPADATSLQPMPGGESTGVRW